VYVYIPPHTHSHTHISTHTHICTHTHTLTHKCTHTQHLGFHALVAPGSQGVETPEVVAFMRWAVFVSEACVYTPAVLVLACMLSRRGVCVYVEREIV
jgi:hypothetical protein